MPSPGITAMLNEVVMSGHGRTNVYLIQNRVECAFEAFEQHIEVRTGVTERRREAEDVVTKGAEDDAVAIRGLRDALRKAQRRIEGRFGLLVGDELECA